MKYISRHCPSPGYFVWDRTQRLQPSDIESLILYNHLFIQYPFDSEIWTPYLVYYPTDNDTNDSIATKAQEQADILQTHVLFVPKFKQSSVPIRNPYLDMYIGWKSISA